MQNYKQIRQLDLFFNYETKFKIDEIMEYISKSDKKFYYLLKRKNQKEKGKSRDEKENPLASAGADDGAEPGQRAERRLRSGL